MLKLKLLGVEKTNPNSDFVCVYRGCGGYGDILNMRLIFEDLKNILPKYKIDWCIPYSYFDAASSHPFVDKLIGLQDFKKSNYKFVFDLTTACTNHEWKFKKETKKNRADIWANHIGYELTKKLMYMPSYEIFFEEIKSDLLKLGWNNKKIIVFCPYSSIQSKNFTKEQIICVKNITKDFFLVALHNKECKFLKDNNIPCISNYTLKKSMSLIQLCDYVITTDTGHLHCAGGYNKKTLGLFCYTNGNNIVKYYNSVLPLQIYNSENELDCGPCYTYTACCKSNDLIKPCRKDISCEIIKKSWEKLLNSNI